MYPHCEEWFHPKRHQRATPKLWQEGTLSSATREFIATASGCFRPWDHLTCAHARTQTHKNPWVSPRRPPGREEGIARSDTPLSCAGTGWRGRRRSSAGPSPSLAAWARNAPLCVCGSWCNVQRPAGTPPGTALFAPRCSGPADLRTERVSVRRIYSQRAGRIARC